MRWLVWSVWAIACAHGASVPPAIQYVAQDLGVDRYLPLRASSPHDDELLEWTKRMHNSTSSAHAPEVSWPADEPVDLLIGVKTAVVGGFANRQLLRETWASRTSLPANVRVLFLGCQPAPNSSEASPWEDHVAHEKVVYGDLLTHELECHDSYFTLVSKVVGFFRWVARPARPSHPRFVMIVDDDVYVNVPHVATELAA